MRLTLKKYEQAKKAVEEAKVHQKVIKTWDEAVKKIGNLGNQRLVAVNFDDEGNVLTTECDLNGHKPQA
jgi:hypothetical protein